MLEGAAIALACLWGGFLIGRRARRKAGPPREVCQCEHEAAFHDAEGCHVGVRGRAARFHDGYAIDWEYVRCPCVRYVGPLTSYFPEIDGVRNLDDHLPK